MSFEEYYTNKGIEQGIEKSIVSLMKSLKCTRDKAMKLLGLGQDSGKSTGGISKMSLGDK